MNTQKKTGYPSIDKPWLKYYTQSDIQNKEPACTLYQNIYSNNSKYLKDTAISYYGNKITYAQLFNNVDACAKSLVKYGIKEGDCVTLCTAAVPEAIYLMIACSKIGAIANFINPLFTTEQMVQQINDIVLSYDNVIGIHDLIVHNYGPGRTLISLHAEVPADGNIITLHDTIDTIEHELRRKLNCNAVIHMDPVSTSDPETLSLKAEVSGYLDQIDPKLSMHDFRIVKGPTHTNVIFDIVIPYDYPVSDQEVMDSITKRIQTSHPDFFTVIEVDKAVVQ